MTRLEHWVGGAALSLAVLGCGGPTGGAGQDLGCPAGATALMTDDGATLWCARPDGTADGPYREVDAAGQVRVLGQFADGLADGLWKGFDALGVLRFEHRFDAGRPCGEWWDAVSGGRETRTFGTCDAGPTGPGDDQRAPVDPPPLWDGETCDGQIRDGGEDDPNASFCYVGASERGGGFARWEDDARAVLIAEGSYADDMLDGSYRTYWPDTGGVKSEGEYAAGAKTGEWRTYDADGWLLEVGSYADGEREGLWTAYYPAGPKRATSEWEAGVKDGQEHRFHPDGSPAEDLRWSSGRREGPYQAWHAGGLGLAIEGVYDDERRVGVWTEYARNGTKISEGTFANGVHQGDWATWSAEGEPLTEGAYDEGVAVGEWTIWSDQGELRIASVGMMVGGVAHGTWVGTWSNGEPFDQVEYVYGRREGAYAAFWPNGQQYAEGAFLNDLPQGPWRFWAEDGELAGEATYHEGERISGWGEVL